MVTIMFFDVLFLIVFCIAIVILLSVKRNLFQKEGWMFLYRTQTAKKAIETFANKHQNFLRKMKYVIITVGFILMAIMIFLLAQTVYTYVAFPQITQLIKAPPVMPLIPYFPQVFGVESLMPPFYFIYFLLALAVVAFVHEFSHGIFMRLFKVRIKSTGIVFLGPILGAFVEQEEKDMVKKKNSEQMTILAAGAFANILFSLIFFIILMVFFLASYQPSGAIFNDYAYDAVFVSSITGFGNTTNNFTEVYVNNRTYLYQGNTTNLIANLNKINASAVLLYMDAPAVKQNLSKIIILIDGQQVRGPLELRKILESKKPDDKIVIETSDFKQYNITLASNPTNSSQAFLGISTKQFSKKGISGLLGNIMTTFKDPNTYYSPKYDSATTKFFYDLFWWIMLINLFVGLFNMLPLGILDGGRFLYLAILSIIKKEESAKRYYKGVTIFIGLIFLAMILAWIFAL